MSRTERIAEKLKRLEQRRKDTDDAIRQTRKELDDSRIADIMDVIVKRHIRLEDLQKLKDEEQRRELLNEDNRKKSEKEISLNEDE